MKTDLIYTTKGSSWLFLGQVTSFVFSFLLSIAFANLLPKEIFGNYRYILALGGSLSAFTLTGMNTAVSQAVARGFEGVYNESIKIQIRWGAITILLTGGLSFWYYYHNNTIFALGVLIVGCSLPFINSFNTYTAFLNGKKDFANLSLYNTCISFFSTAATFTALFLSHNLLIILLTYSLSNTLLNYYFYKKIKVEEKYNIDKQAILYGKHLSFSNWFMVFIQQIELILVFHFLGEVSLAFYYLITLIPEYIKHAFKILPLLAMPRFANRELHELRNTLLQKISLVFISVTIIFLCYLFIAPYILKILFPKYPDLAMYSRIYSLSTFVVISMIPTSILSAKKLIKEIYYFNTISSVIKLTLSFVGIFFFGLLGLVWAIVIYSWLYAISSIILVLIKKKEE